MALEINKRMDQSPPTKAKIAVDRFFYTGDGTRLVGDGHPDAVSLAVAPGHRIHPALVKRFGIVDGKLAKSGENKALKGTSDKKG